MESNKLSRDQVKLISSGKYLDLNKSFDQQQHASFIEGSLFVFDLLNSQKRGNESERASEKRLQSEVQNEKTSN